MYKRKSSKKKHKKVNLHIYGIYDSKKNAITKISIDPEDIHMEIALMGGLPSGFSSCDFDLRLYI